LQAAADKTFRVDPNAAYAELWYAADAAHCLGFNDDH
jgi:hypothetical protein